jgi:hypothetical protein
MRSTTSSGLPRACSVISMRDMIVTLRYTMTHDQTDACIRARQSCQDRSKFDRAHRLFRSDRLQSGAWHAPAIAIVFGATHSGDDLTRLFRDGPGRSRQRLHQRAHQPNWPLGPPPTTHHLHPRAAGLRYAYTHKCVSRPDNLLTLQTRDIRAQTLSSLCLTRAYQPSQGMRRRCDPILMIVRRRLGTTPEINFRTAIHSDSQAGFGCCSAAARGRPLNPATACSD